MTINDHVSSFGEPAAPWGGVKWSGIGRTHGPLGLRELVQPKYVSLDRGRGPELWWYPYDAALGAPHVPSGPRALRHVAAAAARRSSPLLRLRRLWRRFGLLRLLANLDKLW